MSQIYRYQFLVLFMLLPLISFADSPEYGSKVDTNFTIKSEYNFHEAIYEPSISNETLTNNFKRKTFINPQPEFISFSIMDAMINNDYGKWVRYYEGAYSENEEKNSPEDLIKSELLAKEWAELFPEGSDVTLYAQLQVGRAQYTYVLMIYAVLDGQKKSTSYLYFPFKLDEAGQWKYSEALKYHPVFAYYISRKIGKYDK